MAVRYDGTETNTTDLELVSTPPTGPLMAKLSTLLAWHAADPPDAAERARNDAIYTTYQHNRNPFIDHPEWVEAIWGGERRHARGASRSPRRPDAVEQPTIAGVFTVSLSQAATANVTVQFAMSGAAQFGEYTLSGSGVSFQPATGTGQRGHSRQRDLRHRHAHRRRRWRGGKRGKLPCSPSSPAPATRFAATNAATVTHQRRPPSTPAGVIAQWDCETVPARPRLIRRARRRQISTSAHGTARSLPSAGRPATPSRSLIRRATARGSTCEFRRRDSRRSARVHDARHEHGLQQRHVVGQRGRRQLHAARRREHSDTGHELDRAHAWISAASRRSTTRSTVTLRYTLSGCTTGSGNNRLDDIVVRGTPLPSISAATPDADAAEKNGDPATIRSPRTRPRQPAGSASRFNSPEPPRAPAWLARITC